MWRTNFIFFLLQRTLELIVNHLEFGVVFAVSVEPKFQDPFQIFHLKVDNIVEILF